MPTQIKVARAFRPTVQQIAELRVLSHAGPSIARTEEEKAVSDLGAMTFIGLNRIYLLSKQSNGYNADRPELQTERKKPTEPSDQLEVAELNQFYININHGDSVIADVIQIEQCMLNVSTMTLVAIAAVFSICCINLAPKTPGGGSARAPDQIPIIGEHLAELTFIGPASYGFRQLPDQNWQCTLIAFVNPPTVDYFCRRAMVEYQSRTATIEFDDRFMNYLRESGLPVDFDHDAVAGSDVLIGRGNRFAQLRGLYNRKTQQLMLAIECSRAQE